jgi:hypothetical protein
VVAAIWLPARAEQPAVAEPDVDEPGLAAA